MNAASWMSAAVFLVAHLVKALLYHGLSGAQLVVNPGTVHGIYDIMVEEQGF